MPASWMFRANATMAPMTIRAMLDPMRTVGCPLDGPATGRPGAGVEPTRSSGWPFPQRDGALQMVVPVRLPFARRLVAECPPERFRDLRVRGDDAEPEPRDSRC